MIAMAMLVVTMLGIRWSSYCDQDDAATQLTSSKTHPAFSIARRTQGRNHRQRAGCCQPQ